MKNDSSRYYGSALYSLINISKNGYSIKKAYSNTPGFYIVEHTIPIYIKYATSRKSPWTFTFHITHQKAEESLFKEYGECIVIFVCGRDGIAAIPHNAFREMLDSEFEEQESITVKRKHNEMYSLNGKNGSLNNKVSNKNLETIFQNLLNNARVPL